MTALGRAALLEQLQRKPSPESVREAQSIWAPELSFGRHFGPPPHHARRAAVLVAVFQRNDEWVTTLTRRPATLKTHGGEVCFPGGGVEGSESLWECARREWGEELGPSPDWDLVTTLSDIYVFASNHAISSFVAYTESPPEYAPCPAEVGEVMEIPLRHFCEHGGSETREIARWGTRFRTRSYNWGEDQIWGATALVIAELVLRLSTPQAP